MAAEPASIVGDTDIFHQLESYPWDQDAEFQGGLSAILGNTISAEQIYELTLRAQCFYFSRKKSIPIDFDAYKVYITTQNPSKPQEASQESQLHPSQAQIPDQPLHSTTEPSQTTPQNDPKEAPYPQTFAEIVELITSGATIPGIKEIPPTLLTSQATQSVEKKRRKPWEVAIDIPEEAVQGAGTILNGEKKIEGTFGDRRDEVIIQEFPENA